MSRTKPFHLSTKISTILRALETAPVSLGGLVLGLSAWILLRFFLENWVGGFWLGGAMVVPFFLNLLFSFWFSALVFVWFVTKMARVNVGVAARMVWIGFGFILLPPIVDHFALSGQLVASFYVFDGLSGWHEGQGLFWRFLTFFGDRPDFGITYGVRVEVALFTILMAGYVLEKTRQWRRFVAALLGAYAIFFFLGTLPSWVELALEGWQKGFWAVTAVDVARQFMTPQSLFSLPLSDLTSTLSIKMSLVYAVLFSLELLVLSRYFFPRHFWAMIRNARFPQLFYHSGLVCIGMGLAFLFAEGRIEWNFFTLLAFVVVQAAVWLAWLASVVINDWYDTAIDAKTNPSRPLPTQTIDRDAYRVIGWSFFALSLLFGLSISARTAFFLFFFQLLSWIYSAQPFRLKRFPLVATFVSATASWLMAILGFTLVAPGGSLEHFPWNLQFFFLVAMTFVLSLKDLKDIEGDRADGVWTMPVILGEENGKFYVAASIWVAYVASIAVFREPRLFFPALLAGTLSAGVVWRAEVQGRSWLNFRTIFWWIPGIVLVYGLFVAYFALSTISS